MLRPPPTSTLFPYTTLFRSWGTAVMTGLVVPVTMVVTFIAMKILGQTFNLMTLGGLAAAVGLVIDDKIVVVENIVLHRDAGQGPLEATASALKELTIPLIGSTLTPIVVFLRSEEHTS